MAINIKNRGRREFLKGLAGGAAALTVASCGGSAGRSSRGAKGGSTERVVPTDKMTYRTTHTGDKVSLLGYGTTRWPRIEGAKRGENPCDQEAVNELVDYALAHGVNYFDMAPVYMQGWCEQTTGEALSRHPRDSYFIATKISNFGKNTWDRESSLQIYYNSLERFKTDYLDYMLLHSIGGGGDQSMEMFNGRFIDNGILDFLKEERAAGRIRNLGFSFHGDVKIYDHALAMHDRGEVHWDFVQIQMNYLDWNYAEQINPKNVNAQYLYEELAKRDIPVIIMEPLLGGRLASVPAYITGLLKRAEPDKSVASWGFRYSGSFPRVLTILSGMTYMEHLQENICTLSPLDELDESEFKMLDEVAQLIMEYNAIPCNDCKYCMPCPYGLDIPALLLHYNKCIFENKIIENSSDPNYAAARREFLIGYDRSAPKLRQASHCTGCGICNPLCPQNIDIVKELHKIDAYVEDLKRVSRQM